MKSLINNYRSKIVALLRWSEKYTKTDMIYLAGGGFWTMLNYAIQVGIGMITTIILANLLSREALGTYQFILSIAGILSMLTLSGMGASVTRSVAQGHHGVLRHGVQTKLKWSIGIVIGSGLVSVYYSLNDNTALALAFLIVGAFAPFIESFRLYENYLHGKEAFRDSVLLGVWRKPLPLISLIITVWLTDNVLTLIFVYFASNTVSYLLVYLAVIRKHKPPKESHPETLRLGKHLSVFRIAGTVSQHADKVLIWHFLGAGAVAVFSIAQLASQYSGGFINTLTSLVLPRVSKRDLPTLQNTLPRKVLLFTGLMAIGAGFYILIVPIIFPLLFPKYPESILISQVLAVVFIFIPRKIYAKVLIAHDQTKAQYILSFSALITKLILLYILLPIYGLWGAVFAILATELTVSALVRYFFVKAT